MNSIREKIQAVKKGVKITDVLRLHGIVVPEGVSTQISCPFHGADSHPSARVYPDTNAIFCFTCHKIWDSLAAEMQFSELGLVESVDFLLSKFNVPVQEQNSSIVSFYAQATRYQRGDQKRVNDVIKDLGDRFRKYYQSVDGWQAMSHVVEYLWEEYDEIYSMEASPSRLVDLASDWFTRAHTVVSLSKDLCSTAHTLEVV